MDYDMRFPSLDGVRTMDSASMEKEHNLGAKKEISLIYMSNLKMIEESGWESGQNKHIFLNNCTN